MRVALRFAYDGQAFERGYARQPEGGTVEDALLGALGDEGYAEGSWRTGSRTDRGVSAAENVAACVLDRPHLRGLVPALQSRLPEGLWITGAAPAADDWNPRHAVRTYAYFAVDRGEDPRRLADACAAFVGRHDVRAFARVEDRSPQREIAAFDVAAQADLWRFTCTSPGFLWNQVRRMVDAALRVGRGEADVADIEAALRTGKPHGSFKLAPPDGLVLQSVRYDPEIQWLAEAGTTGPALAGAAACRAAVASAVSSRLQRWAA